MRNPEPIPATTIHDDPLDTPVLDKNIGVLHGRVEDLLLGEGYLLIPAPREVREPNNWLALKPHKRPLIGAMPVANSRTLRRSSTESIENFQIGSYKIRSRTMGFTSYQPG